MKVDNKTNVAFNQKRNTVRISTKDRFAVGSVWIADMLHVPFGVSLSVSLSCHPSGAVASTRSVVATVWLTAIFTTLWRQAFLYHAYTDAIRIHCIFSALSGLPSGLKLQTGPQAAKSTRLKASTWYTTRKLRCIPSPAAPL